MGDQDTERRLGVDITPALTSQGREDALGEGIAIVLRVEETGHAQILTDWLACYPDLAGELAGFLAAQRGIQSISRRLVSDQAETVDDLDLDLNPSMRKLGGLELGEELDRGGMGVVYRAYDPVLKRDVAVKRVLSGAFTTAEERARFRFEAEAAAGLSHPAVVPIHSFGEEAGGPYLVMALMEGGSLAKKLRDRGPNNPFSPPEAANLIRDVAQGVHHAHQRGLLHRDLKPANILFDAGSRPRIADFGLALTLEATFSLSLGGSVAGTAAYMSPEQIEGGKSLTTAVDIHALGVILYELLAGQPPFGREEWLVTLQRVRDEEAPGLRERRPEVPRDLETICLRCLEKDPADRYPSAQALAEDLDRFLQGEPLAYRRPGWFVGLSRVLARRRLTSSMASWPGCYFAAVLVLLTHGVVEWLVLAGHGDGWAYAALGINLAGWLGLYCWYLLSRMQSLTAVERLSAGVQFGTMLACLALVSGVVANHGWEVLPFYPPLTAVLGLGLFAHGATHWGWFYFMGVVLMLVALFMPLFSASTWPVIHGLAVAAILVRIGGRLHDFDQESRTMGGGFVPDARGPGKGERA